MQTVCHYRTGRVWLVLSALAILFPPLRSAGQPPNYTLTDLGVLGAHGTIGRSYAQTINNKGQVVGISATGAGFDHACLWQNGQVVDLGTLPGDSYSAATAINESGQVVGYSSVGPLFTGGTTRGFLWTPTTPNGTTGTMTDLGLTDTPPDNSLNSEAATGINDRGQVVGSSISSDGSDHAVLWTPTTPNGTTGTTTDLGTLGGPSYAHAINAAGQVVGVSINADGGNAHAFLWTPTTTNGTNGTMLDLGTLPGEPGSAAYGLNNHGQVVGGTDGTGRAFLWDSVHGMLDMGMTGTALAINDTGQVVGDMVQMGEQYNHAFLWTPTMPNGVKGVLTDLGALPNQPDFNQANGINATGQVVGIGNGDFTAFLWTPTLPNGATGTLTDLGTLPNPFSFAYGLNAAGQVVGSSSITADTVAHGFLWENGVLTDIGSLFGGDSAAYAINTMGSVVGASHNHAFLWQNGALTDLGPGAAYSINAVGQIAGANGHAVLWQNGMIQDLGTLPNQPRSAAYGLNDQGQVVGSSVFNSFNNSSSHIVVFSPAFLWQQGVMTSLGTLPGDAISSAYAINAVGQVVGASSSVRITLVHPLHAASYFRYTQGATRAFLWQNSSMTALNSLGGDSQALAINAIGQIVGVSDTPNSPAHAALWQNGVIYDLNSLTIAASDWVLHIAGAINTQGQIAGSGTLNGEPHAFLLTPVPVTVSGKITLQDCMNQAQPLTFEFRPTNGGASFTRILTLKADQTFTLSAIPRNQYAVWMKGAKWLAKVVLVDTTNGDLSGITATLLAGDADNNNIVDFDDLTILAIAYNTSAGDPSFDDRADFNCDGQVEFADLTLLAINYNLSGDP